MFRHTFFTIFLLLIIIFTSCKKTNRFVINEQNVTNSLRIIRFDSLLLNTHTPEQRNKLLVFYRKNPDFISGFSEQIMGLNPTDTAKIIQYLIDFTKNTEFKTVNSDVQKVFYSTDSVSSQLEQGYKYLNHYFPEIKTPPVYFFVSGFNRSIILNDKYIGVGLDMYLGNTYLKYESISYQYMVYNMRPASIAPDVISAILFRYFKFDGNQERLLENMLYRGKVMYLLSIIMPDIDSNEIMGYTKFQWEWSRKYEDKIWNTIVGQKDLYSTDQLLINKYMNDAPFTAPVSQESPGRLGTWVGWQIIQKFMDKNSEITLPQLMKLNDYQLILNKSEYKP